MPWIRVALLLGAALARRTTSRQGIAREAGSHARRVTFGAVALVPGSPRR